MLKIMMAERGLLSSVVLCALFTTGMVIIQAFAPQGSKGSCGQLAFAHDQSENREIYLIDVQSRVKINLTHSPINEDYPFWSPAGDRLAYIVTDSNISREIVVQSIATDDRQHYSFPPVYDDPPRFSTDGQVMIISGKHVTGQLINLVTGMMTTTTGTALQANEEANPGRSPGNQPLLYTASNGITTRLLLINPAESRQIAIHDGSIFAPVLSADGHCVAYTAGSTGNRRVYIVDLIHGNGQLLVDAPGDYSFPVWRTQQMLKHDEAVLSAHE